MPFVQSKDGAKVYADATGDPSKPCLVFLHGLGLSSSVFNGLFENKTLLDQFYLVRYDMRGHGRTVKPDSIDGYVSDLYAADFAAVMDEFKVKRPILVGWSLGCTVACDVAAHLPKDYLAGIVYISALPYIGSIMHRVGTPTVLGFLPSLFATNDVNDAVDTGIAFTDSVFADPDSVPFDLKVSWIGMSHLQKPAVTQFVLSRPQDPTKLLELGKEGLPLLIVNGTKDKQVYGDVVVKEMQPYFKSTKVHTVEGAGHAVFYDAPDDLANALSAFAKEVLSA